MSNSRISCTIFIYANVLLIATLASSTPAFADRFMLVLLDASGSMSTPTNGQSRFAAAAAAAELEVNFIAGQEDPVNPNLFVAVYTFQDVLLTQHTNGFIKVSATTQFGVADVIECIGGIQPATTDCSKLPASIVQPGSTFPVIPFGQTPLAGSICNSLTTLLAMGDTTSSRILEVSSDGMENSTPSGPCMGTLDGTFDQTTGWSSGSWQANVINFFTNQHSKANHVSAHVDLFQFQDFPPAFRTASDPKGILASDAHLFSVTPVATSGSSSLEQFFASLTEVTGGYISTFNDNHPLPVLGDVNGDGCVDIDDALLVARAFGQPVLASPLDVSIDGSIGFNDYELVTNNIKTNCGRRSPYVSRDPLVCYDRTIIIDGKSIGDRETTIEARGECEIIIKNSLIVAGQNAISITGKALLKIDNSILVGEDAVLRTKGATLLSAANTVFHGTRSITGEFEYIDRGGNTWEQPDGPPANSHVHCGRGFEYHNEYRDDRHRRDHDHDCGDDDHRRGHHHDCHDDDHRRDHDHDCRDDDDEHHRPDRQHD